MRKDVIGRIGEQSVIAELLKKEFEAYLAINKNQIGWDIVVILPPASGTVAVKRIQVKTTILQNGSTNNVIYVDNSGYDYLVIVVIDGSKLIYYVLTLPELIEFKQNNGNNRQLYISEVRHKKYCVREYLSSHRDKWNKIKGVTL